MMAVRLPAGILIREVEGVIVLEERVVEDGENVEVLAIFDEQITLDNPKDLNMCLETARIYEPDLSIPIYIKTLEARYENEEKRQKERKAYLESVVERAATHPWDYVPK